MTSAVLRRRCRFTASAENGLRTADRTICGVPGTPVDPRHAWMPRKARDNHPDEHTACPDDPASAGSRPKQCQKRECQPFQPPTHQPVRSGSGSPGRDRSAPWMAHYEPPWMGSRRVPDRAARPTPSTRHQGASALHERPNQKQTAKKNPAEAGFFVEQHNQQRDQSPCCFCRCSQRSCASIVRSAVRRASRRSRPISSPVSTQKP